MRALSIRQPWAELIMRGVKTVEYRSRPTRIVGERFYIYAAKGPSGLRRGNAPRIWSRDLQVPGLEDSPPTWLIELAGMLRMVEPEALLPRGLIVGSAVIEKVTPPDPRDGDRGLFRWHLRDIERIATPIKPTGRPQPVWFAPF